jgi:hypothetical protein
VRERHRTGYRLKNPSFKRDGQVISLSSCSCFFNQGTAPNLCRHRCLEE